MMRVWPYSGWTPAKTTVPGAGDFTAVPMDAPMSRPLWNSDLDDQGDTRPPKPELTGPRSGQREGRAARTRVARTRNRSDRKSTRLNSSHVAISYAVFCLKKKKK